MLAPLTNILMRDNRDALVELSLPRDASHKRVFQGEVVAFEESGNAY